MRFVRLCAGTLLVLGGLAGLLGADAINGPVHEGVRASVDYPPEMWMKNIGSHIDGSGMCVDTSLEMAGRWAGVPGIEGFRDYWAQKERGGNYPQGVARQIPAYFKAKGLPVPEFVQYEGPHPEEVLALASKTGRVAGMTYGYSPRYRGTIAHMTACPHFGDRWAVCLDNNAIGGVQPPDKLYEWMSAAELVKRVKHPNGSGWVVVWLATPPPPPVTETPDDAPPSPDQ